MINMDKRLEKKIKDFKEYEPETYYHCLRVKKYVYRMLSSVLVRGHISLSNAECEIVCKGAMLHDIGKRDLDNRILTSLDKLTGEEKLHVQKHTELGCKELEGMLSEDEEEIIDNICRYHHEKIDGSGYLGMTEIPEYVQIVSICDVYDALTSDRVYREGYDSETAIEMIESGECGVFEDWLIEGLHNIM